MNLHHALIAPVLDDAYANVTAGAHTGAYGANDLKTPSDAQAQAGTYKMGRVTVQGLRIAIEQPCGSIRSGKGADGKEWSSRMAAHYGYFEGTRGADGDGIDCFVGPYPESEQVFVINQRNPGGGFDEHKVLIGFASERHARGAYLDSYERGWRGLQSLVPISLDQLRWWIKHGKKTIALTAESLPQQGTNPMNPKITWNEALPDSISLDQVLYQLRRMDGTNGLLLDSVTMAEIMEDTDGVIALDALVVENAQLTRMAERLRAIMDRSGGTVKAPAVQVSEPFRARGVTNIAAVFELSDGQTVSVFFHNPDTAPNKLAPGDEMISWKWLLNKKDITIVVAPEKGQDLNPRLVAQRIMRLAEKNSPAFQKANAKRAERMSNIEAIRGRIAEKEATLTDLVAQVEAARLEKSQKTIQQEDANAATREEVKKWLEGSGYAVKDAAMSEYTKTIGDRIMFVSAARLQLVAAVLDSTKLLNGRFNTLTKEFQDALVPSAEGDTQPAMGYAAGFEAIKGFVEGREREGVTVVPAGEGEPTPYEIYKEGNGETGRIDSAYEAKHQMLDALDAMDTPPGTYYGKDTNVGDVIYSFQARTEILKATRRVTLAEFVGLMKQAVRWSNKEHGMYSTDWLERNAPNYLALRHGINAEWAAKAFAQWKLGDAGSLEPEQTPAQRVDAAYQFANATDAFKERVAGSIEETDYSEFATAKAMDMKAKELGAEIHWGMGAALDSVQAEEGDDEGGDDDFDAAAEFDACPVEDGDLDGDFKGHPFRGNQHKKASSHSHAAVRASMSAKYAEKDGDTKGAKSAHKSAHYSHMAAAEGTTGQARKYHRKMAKFHGSRAGMTLDGVEGWDGITFDDASDFSGGNIVGKIMQGGKQMGRAVIVGDGKAMVFVGKSNDKRVVSTATGNTAAWGEDERMIEWLLGPVKSAEKKLSKKEAEALAAAEERAAAKANAVAIGEQIDAIAKAGLKLPEGISYKFDIEKEASWFHGGPGATNQISFYLDDKKEIGDVSKFHAEARISLDQIGVILWADHGGRYAEQQREKLIPDNHLKADSYEDLANQIVQALNGAIEKHIELSSAPIEIKIDKTVYIESIKNEMLSAKKGKNETLVRQRRNSMFDAEDAVEKAIDGNDLAEFEPYKELFPKTHALLAQAVGAAVPEVETDELTVEGKESKVKTAKGTEVVTGFSVVEASRLITSHDPATGDVNPDFPQELQPRDRGRQTSRAWVLKTAANLDPEQLGKTRRADTGAPIVGKDRVVESGNGRTMAIIEAYRTGKADEYREWLESEAEYFGLDPQKVKAMKRPVLVRVRTSKVNRAEFAVEANQDDKLAMTATEKAKADANRLTDDMIALMTDNGDLNSAGNHRFLSAFLASLGDAEAAQYSTSDGKPTSSLIARVQAAIFAKAYNDDRLLELTADSAKPEIANIISALNFAAPEFIQAIALDPKATADATEKLTDSIEASLNEQAVAAIISATNVIKQAKETGMQVDEFVKQQGLFGDIDPSVAAMAVFISKNNRSAKRMGSAFKAMATFVKGEIQRRQTTDMFGDSVNVGFPEIIAAANRELEREYGEGVFAIETIDMFARKNDPAPALEPVVATDAKNINEQDFRALVASKGIAISDVGSVNDEVTSATLKFNDVKGELSKRYESGWKLKSKDFTITGTLTEVLDEFVIAATPEPTVTPEPAPAPADPKTKDRAFFMSVIDGSHPEILEPELADKLAQAYERHAGDAEITSLFMQAGNAYTQAMLAATEGV